MRKRGRFGSLLCATIAVAMAAMIGAAGFGSAVVAQQGPTTGIVLFELFTGPESAELKPGAAQQLADAARKAQAPGSCPLGQFTVFVAQGDPTFQAAVGSARRDVVLLALDSQGIDASRFFVDFRVFGGKTDMPGNDAQLDYDVGRDQTAPKLDVIWTPPKGTKVKAGGKITAKAVARDDANRWQTGIKSIDLEVQDGGRFGFQDYPQPQPPCERPPPPQTLEGAYTVPSNPRPIVRLRAVTKDFAGHDARDIAEFPTGDWYGPLEFSSESVVKGVKTTIKDHMDIVLEYDGRGNLTGTLVATRSFNQQGSPNCNWAITIPNKLRGKLVGSYTPGAEVMSTQLVEPVVAPDPKKSCPDGGYIDSGGSIHEWPPFKRVLQSLRAVGDGTFRSSFEETTGPVTNRISLTLRPAQN